MRPRPTMPFAALVPRLRAAGSLPAPVRGALWMCCAAAAFACMVNLVRLLSATFDPLQIVFFRTAFGLLALLPWLAGHGIGALRTERLGLHLLRAAVGLVAMVLWFTSLALLPLAEATALSFTAPVFTSMLAVLFLGEAMRARRWTATAIGFLGALIVLRPGIEAVDPAALLAILTAAIWAASTIVVKVLARTDEPAAIATYMALLLTPLSLAAALFVWRAPGPADLALCALLGAAGSIGHVCMARALAISEASLVMPFDYLRLPLVAFFAYLLFDQVPDIWTWVGGAVIAGSSLYIAHREARLRRPARTRPAAVRRLAVLWRRRCVRPWLALPANLRGALWIGVSCLFFASSSALVKLLGQRLDTFGIAFFRSVFGLLMILPFLVRAGPGIFRTPHLGLHLVRALFGVAGMVSGFYAVTHLRLADAAALGFTTPLFMIVLAALALGETVRARRWTATLIGFAGVLIMVRPGAGVVELAALVAVFGAFCGAVVKLLIKRLTATENHLTMLAWLGLFTTAFTGIPAVLAWQTPTAHELTLLIALGAVSSLAQVCMIRGYGVGEASAMAPIEYARLPFAAIYGLLLFAELPDGWSLLGALIIVGSTLYIARREAQLGRRAPVPRSATDA